MTNNLHRLFTFAKAHNAEALENFTTERSRPQSGTTPKPVFDALGEAGVALLSAPSQ